MEEHIRVFFALIQFARGHRSQVGGHCYQKQRQQKRRKVVNYVLKAQQSLSMQRCATPFDHEKLAGEAVTCLCAGLSFHSYGHNRQANDVSIGELMQYEQSKQTLAVMCFHLCYLYFDFMQAAAFQPRLFVHRQTKGTIALLDFLESKEIFGPACRHSRSQQRLSSPEHRVSKLPGFPVKSYTLLASILFFILNYPYVVCFFSGLVRIQKRVS